MNSSTVLICRDLSRVYDKVSNRTIEIVGRLVIRISIDECNALEIATADNVRYIIRVSDKLGVIKDQDRSCDEIVPAREVDICWSCRGGFTA